MKKGDVLILNHRSKTMMGGYSTQARIWDNTLTKTLSWLRFGDIAFVEASVGPNEYYVEVLTSTGFHGRVLLSMVMVVQ